MIPYALLMECKYAKHKKKLFGCLTCDHAVRTVMRPQKCRSSAAHILHTRTVRIGKYAAFVQSVGQDNTHSGRSLTDMFLLSTRTMRVCVLCQRSRIAGIMHTQCTLIIIIILALGKRYYCFQSPSMCVYSLFSCSIFSVFGTHPTLQCVI